MLGSKRLLSLKPSLYIHPHLLLTNITRVSECECLCVRERERERERGKPVEDLKSTYFKFHAISTL